MKKIQRLLMIAVAAIPALFFGAQHAAAYQTKHHYSISSAEVPTSIELYLSHGGRTDTSAFGVSVSATPCVDSLLGEMEQPPPPPFGNLYSCFLESNCQINGLKYDLHHGNPTTTTVDTFRLRFQLTTVMTMPATLHWSSAELREYATSARIVPLGVYTSSLSVDMLQDSVIQWNPLDPNLATLSDFRFYITWKPVARYSIVAAAGPHGQITPVGSSTVYYGSDITYTVIPDSSYSVDSLLVDGVMFGWVTQYTFHGVNSDHTLRAAFAQAPPITVQQNISPKWNIVSIPAYLTEHAKTQLYPSAISNAYSYNGAYGVAPTLIPGYGYWMKFSNAQTVSLSGFSCVHATIPVTAGWNLIGSLSVPLAVTAISVEPADLVASGVFGFNNGYVQAETLMPGNGYWIKVNKDGFLNLSGNPGVVVSHPIHFQPISEPLPRTK